MSNESGLADTGVPPQFERNRYFDGKLLTARDMTADQAYHRGQLQAVVRGTLGVGIVTGLEVIGVTETDGRLTATVQPGVALDAAGRPVVVPPATGDVTVRAPNADRPLDVDEVGAGDVLALRLRHDACATERVPVPGSEHVTGEGGEHGRVVESFVLEGHPATTDAGGDPVPPKPVPEVTLTDPDDEPSFDRGASTVPLVLAWAEKTDTGDWALTSEGRPLVYPTDLAYATAATHATDRENPHDVTVSQVAGAVSSVGGATPAADGSVGVQTANGPLSVSTSGSDLVFDSDAVRSVTAGGTAVPAGTDGTITLTSPDGSVGLAADPGNNAVNLTATTVDDDQFVQELGGLADHDGQVRFVSTDDSVAVVPEPDGVDDPESTLDVRLTDEFTERLESEFAGLTAMVETLSQQVVRFSKEADESLLPVTVHPEVTIEMASRLLPLDVVTLEEFRAADASKVADRLGIGEDEAAKLQEWQ
jgi:hypothetical protein